MERKQMQRIFKKTGLEKQGYSFSTRGFVTILEPKNLTEETSGIIQFKKEIDVDEEIGEMIEDRVLG